MTSVSPATEMKLRDAMQRLLAGKPQRTDGRLTKTDLHLEAGVSPRHHEPRQRGDRRMGCRCRQPGCTP
jgi:hypothetical protein